MATASLILYERAHRSAFFFFLMSCLLMFLHKRIRTCIKQGCGDAEACYRCVPRMRPFWWSPPCLEVSRVRGALQLELKLG